LQIADGCLHNYQDCDSDPRNGCEDTARWCQLGQSDSGGRYSTQSDKCSQALLYACDTQGFDSNDSPCADPATGLFLPFPAPNAPTVDCWDVFTNAAANNVSLVNFAPYCDRNVTHLDTRGDCVFECDVGFENCNRDPNDGCEAHISDDGTCSHLCIECLVLSGIDRTVAPNCIADAANPGEYKCNFTCPGTIDTTVNCADADGKWETGCEVATNQDTDTDGVFMNEGVAMDCSIMEAEAAKNPDLFRHHLHIDLTKPVPTSIPPKTLPAGSIFCNNNLADNTLSKGLNGKCFFMCIDGFDNTDRFAYNGCEDINATVGAAYPYTFGGYWIGDPLVEDYLEFLCTTSSNTIFNVHITYPYNVCNFHDRVSEFWLDTPFWY